MQVFWLDRVISPVHLLALVPDDLHSGHGIDPCSPQIRAGGMPKSCRPHTLRTDPRPRQAAAKAVRGFFQAFPLYRKTLLVSRRRSFQSSMKVW